MSSFPLTTNSLTKRINQQFDVQMYRHIPGTLTDPALCFIHKNFMTNNLFTLLDLDSKPDGCIAVCWDFLHCMKSDSDSNPNRQLQEWDQNPSPYPSPSPAM